jgi:hypothetical protein
MDIQRKQRLKRYAKLMQNGWAFYIENGEGVLMPPTRGSRRLNRAGIKVDIDDAYDILTRHNPRPTCGGWTSAIWFENIAFRWPLHKQPYWAREERSYYPRKK